MFLEFKRGKAAWPYTTVDELSKALPADRLRELSDDAGTGEIDAGIVQWAIDTAAEVIDSYIGQVAGPAPVRRRRPRAPGRDQPEPGCL